MKPDTQPAHPRSSRRIGAAPTAILLAPLLALLGVLAYHFATRDPADWVLVAAFALAAAALAARLAGAFFPRRSE